MTSYNIKEVILPYLLFHPLPIAERRTPSGKNSSDGRMPAASGRESSSTAFGSVVPIWVRYVHQSRRRFHAVLLYNCNGTAGGGEIDVIK